MAHASYLESKTERSTVERASQSSMGAVASMTSPRHVPLSIAAQRMLASIPEDLCIDALRARHAHVLEDLAACYQDPRALKRMLDKVMFTGSGGSMGLSLDALMELAELKNYFMQVLYGERPSVWDQSMGLV